MNCEVAFIRMARKKKSIEKNFGKDLGKEDEMPHMVPHEVVQLLQNSLIASLRIK